MLPFHSMQQSIRDDHLTFLNSLTKILRILWGTAPWRVTFFLLLAIPPAVAPLAIGFLFQKIYDGITVEPYHQSDLQVSLIVLFYGLLALCGLFSVFLRTKFGHSQRSFWRILDGYLDQKIASVNCSQLETREVENKISNVRGRIGQVVMSAQGALDLFPSIFGLVLSAIIITKMNWKLGLIVISLTALPRIWSAWRHGIETRQLEDSTEQTIRKFYWRRWQLHMLEYLRELQVYQKTDWYISKMREVWDQALSPWERQHRRDLHRNMLSELVTWLVQSGALVFFVLAASDKEISIGQLNFLLAAVFNTSSSISSLCLSIISLGANEAAVRGYKWLDDFCSINAVNSDNTTDQGSAPSIEFKQVSFSYPGSEKQVLIDLNFKINSGDKVALVGQNGSGKSTIIQLITLLRRIDPASSGKILLDGINSSEIADATWRSRLALMLQRVVEYNSLTVREAVEIGQRSGGLSPEQAIQCIGAEEVIANLPKGWDTVIHASFDNGITLSGGQQQRIAAARAICRKAPLLIMDEPGANLDPQKEALLMDYVLSLPESTVIVSTQYFGHMPRFDKIIVVEQGKIEAIGTHSELILTSPSYKVLYQSQANLFIQAQ